MEEEKQKDSKALLLEAGTAAIQKLYQSYLMRIKAGETLSRSEIKAFRELEKELQGPEESTTLPDHNAAAEYLGISTRMLRWHRGKGNVKQNPDGSFDRLELDRFISTHGKRKQTRDLAEKRMLADLRYRLARAEKEETLVRQLKGELMSLAELEAALEELVMLAKRAFMLLPKTAPGMLVGLSREEMVAALTKMTDEILEGLANGATVRSITAKLKAVTAEQQPEENMAGMAQQSN